MAAPVPVRRAVNPAKRRLPPSGNGAPQVQPAQPAAPTKEAAKVPWSPASAIADKQGLNFHLFGLVGCGKTTLGISAANSEHGRPLLVVNFDCEVRSISDRSDIMVWPGADMDGQLESWRQFTAFNSKLVRGKHPFKTILFDTVSSGYDFAYKEVIGKSSTRRDGRQEFGEANQMVLDVVREWAMISREQGINVIFTTHADEDTTMEGDRKVTTIRPAVTPGVVKGMYKLTSTIGYLEEGMRGRRKLLLHNTVKVVAKVHQPQSGSPIDLEIPNPDLGRMIEHFKGIRPYKTESE